MLKPFSGLCKSTMVPTRVSIAITLISVLGVFAVVALQSFISQVDAAPIEPHVVFGQVRAADGTPLDAGLGIEARINNINYIQTVSGSSGLSSRSVNTHSIHSGAYNYGTLYNAQICSDDPESSVIEGGTDGQPIVFFVAGIQAQVQRVGVDSSAVGTLAFSAGSAAQRIDLVIPSLSAPQGISGTSSSNACSTLKPATAPTPTPTFVFVGGGGGAPAPTATPEPEPEPAAAEAAPLSGATLLASTDTASVILGALAATDAAQAANALIESGDLDLASTTTILTSLIESDAEVAGTVFVQAMLLDLDKASAMITALVASDVAGSGKLISQVVHLDLDTAVSLLTGLAAADATVSGTLLAHVAVASAFNAGQLLIGAFISDSASVTLMLVESGKVNADSIGGALASVAKDQPEKTGQLLAAASDNDIETMSNVLVAGSVLDAENMGIALGYAAVANPTAIGNLLADSASIDPTAIGNAMASAANSDRVSIGAAIVIAAVRNAESIGLAFADGAAANPESIGRALAIAAASDVVSIGKALTSAVSKNAESIGSAMGYSAKDDAGSTVAALASGPAKDSVALKSLGAFIPHELWVPESEPKVGVDPLGGQWSFVGSQGQVDQILAKFTSDPKGARVSVASVDAPAVPDVRPGRVAYSETGNVGYVQLSTDGFDDSAMEVGHLTLSVLKSWIASKGIHEWSIQFSRFDEGQYAWRPSLVKRSRETDDRVYYTLPLPGFSTWSITGSTVAPSVQVRVEEMTISKQDAYHGEILTVSANVKNITSATVEYIATLWVDDKVHSTKKVLVPPNVPIPVYFDLVATLCCRDGYHDVRIGRITDSFTVKPALMIKRTVIVSKPVAVAMPVAAKPVVKVAVVPTATTVPPTPAPPRPTPTRVVVPTTVPAPVVVVVTATPTKVPPPAPVKVALALPATPVPTVVPTPLPVPKVEPTATVVPAPTSAPPAEVSPTATAVPEIVEDGGVGLTTILLVVVVIAIVGGGAAFYYLRRQGS